MINQSTIAALRAMKLTAMADELEAQFADQTTYSQLGFEDRLGLLVDAEWNRRKSNKLLRFIRNARFAEPGATIEGIESTMTGSSTKPRFSGWPPVNISKTAITSF